MRYPKSIKVGPYEFTLVKDKWLGPIAQNAGVTGTDVERIHIATGLSKGMERDTVLHEALHAVWTQTALDRKYDEEAEEEAIWQLSPRILALLRDNPELVEYLTS